MGTLHTHTSSGHIPENHFKVNHKVPSTPPRLCHAGFAPEQDKAGTAAARAAELGFSHIVFGANGAVRSGESQPIRQLVEACAAGDLEILLDLEISELPLDHPLVHLHPECFTLTAQGCGEYVDPRMPNSTRGCAIAHPQQNPEAFIAWWTDMLSRLSGAGVRGFRVLEPQICGGQVWGELIARLRQRNPAQLFVADTSRLAQHDVSDLRQAGFDFCLSALPWWNGRGLQKPR